MSDWTPEPEAASAARRALPKMSEPASEASAWGGRRAPARSARPRGARPTEEATPDLDASSAHEARSRAAGGGEGAGRRGALRRLGRSVWTLPGPALGAPSLTPTSLCGGRGQGQRAPVTRALHSRLSLSSPRRILHLNLGVDPLLVLPRPSQSMMYALIAPFGIRLARRAMEDGLTTEDTARRIHASRTPSFLVPNREYEPRARTSSADSAPIL